ncbi:mechanosensitive ion channel family protein [Gracilimonas halophila]|uniref:Mechanosensitive ion channel family protein n=1 Tax=Gracilimonas halophila TaxID=1834464 RepID=A0ABW5JEA4_9BACT
MQDLFELQLQRLIESVPQILGAVFTIVVLVFAGQFVSNGIEKVLGKRKTKAIKQTRLIKRLIRWGFSLIGIVIALNLLGLSQVAASFLAAGGVMAVVLGFAFREIGENLLAGLFLSFSRSFDVGDIIESNGIRGKVKRIEIREVHIRTAEGCDIFIPSAIIYKNPLHNFTRDGLRRGRFTIGIDYGDDPQNARELLLSTVQNNENTLKQPAPTVQISGFNPGYIELEVLFWVNTFSESADLIDVRSQLMKACHQALAVNGYTFSSNVTTAIDMLPVDVNVNS